MKICFRAKRTGYYLFLGLAISGGMLQTALLQTAQTAIESIQPQVQELFSEINEKCIPLTTSLSAIFDAIGQSYATKNIGKSISKDQKPLVEMILIQLRQATSQLETQAATYQSKEATLMLLQQIAGTIDVLSTIINQGLEKLLSSSAKQNKRSIIITPENISTITIEQANQLLSELEKEVTLLNKASESLGLSTVNKMFRWSRGWWNRLYVGTAISKILHYTAFGALILYTMPEGMLVEKWPFLASKVPAILRNERPSAPQSLTPAKTETAQPAASSTETTPPNTPTSETTTAAQPTQTSNNKVITGSRDSVAYLNHPLSWLIPITLSTGLGFDLGKYLTNYLLSDATYLWDVTKKLATKAEDTLFGVSSKTDSGKTLTGQGITFKDIIGREEVKAELEKIIDYACNPGKYDRSGITPSKGYLFVGPSQNGKSAMIEALGNELANRLRESGKSSNVIMQSLTIDDILAGKNTMAARLGFTNEVQQGDTSPIGLSQWVAYYKWRAQGAPLIISIDEIDMLKLQRDGDSRLLGDFLTTMSGGLSGSEKNMVIIIGLTNKPSTIDFALREPGRFGKLLWFNKPTYNDRLEFFEKAIKKRFMDPSKFSCKKLAYETEGISYGALLAVEKRAFFLAKQAGVAVNQSHFEDAINTEVKKIIYSDQELPAEKIDIIATHQAGKALVSMLLDPKRKLSKVTIRRYTREIQEESQTNPKQNGKNSNIGKADQRIVANGGIFSYSHEDELDISMHDDLIKQCKILLAGNIAQQVLNIKNKSFDKSDKEAAFDIAHKIALEGLEDRFEVLPKQIQQEMLTKAYTLIKQYEAEVANLLTEHKAELTAIIQALKELKDLDRTEIAEIMYTATHPE